MNQIRDIVLEEHYLPKLKRQAFVSYTQGRNVGWNEVLGIVQELEAANGEITVQSIVDRLQQMINAESQTVPEVANASSEHAPTERKVSKASLQLVRND